MLYLSNNEIEFNDFQRFDVTDWDQISERISYRLMNKKVFEATKDVDNIIHENCADFTKIFMISEVSKDRKYMLYHDLNREDIDKFDKSYMDVAETSIQNMSKDTARRIHTLSQSTMSHETMYPLLRLPDNAMLGTQDAEGFIKDSSDGNDNVLIITNKYSINGASYMLDFKTLNDVHYRMQDDFYVIPTSVHHFMCINSGYVCKNKDITEAEDDMLDMLFKFNDSNKVPEDILSYKIYKYIDNDGKILIPIKQKL